MKIEILKTLIWPGVTLCLGAIALIMCRKSLNTAISNIKRFGTKSIQLEMNAQSVTRERVDKDAMELLIGRFSEYTRPLESGIDIMIENKKISDPHEIIKILKGHASLWFLAYQYEIIYHTIFGTQINFMQHLNANPEGITSNGIDSFHKISISRGLTNFSREKYVEYLLNVKLLEFKENKYFITLFGKGFLHFLLEAHKEIDKVL